MASYIFNDILSKGAMAGQIPAQTRRAREWYRNTAQQVGRISNNQFLKDKSRLTNEIRPGSMYMFAYEAKTKQLPYFDRFPLVFPISTEGNGFMGLNLHYLPHQYRAILMDQLYETITNDRFDETTRIRTSYEILNRSRKFRYFKPCIKRYLLSNTGSRFIYINPSEWDIALFLPTERFTGASKDKVWSESRKKF